MKRKVKGFTLAEILGVIVILGTLMILIAPPIIKQLNSKKALSKDALYELVYTAASQYMKEKPQEYKTGKRYCLPIQTLIDAGKLSSPVVSVDSGEKLDNYYVLVSRYSSGDEYYEIKKGDECGESESLPMIDFMVYPAPNVWSNQKEVQIIYPDRNGEKSYKKDNGSWNTKNDDSRVIFTENGTLEARMKLDDGKITESKMDVGNIDSIKPTVSSSNPDYTDSNNITITLKDTGGSNLKGYLVTTSSATPTINSSWKIISPSVSDKTVKYKIEENGTYYIYAIDNAGNISEKYSKKFNVKNTVTYDAAPGTFGGGTTKQSYVLTNGDKYKTPTPTRTGYTLDGWYTAKTGGSKVTGSTVVNLSSNQTLYAHWTANTYTISFSPNGGSGSVGNKTCTYDQDCTLPSSDFTRSGYYFSGWAKSSTGSKAYDGGEKVKNLLTSGSMTLYAYWTDVCDEVYYKDGTDCSAACGGGTKNRLAYSKHDNSRCQSNDIDSGGSSCNTFDCCSQTTENKSCGDWGSCSRTCGGGWQSRSCTIYTVSAYDGNIKCASERTSSEDTSCNTQACASTCTPSCSCLQQGLYFCTKVTCNGGIEKRETGHYLCGLGGNSGGGSGSGSGGISFWDDDDDDDSGYSGDDVCSVNSHGTATGCDSCHNGMCDEVCICDGGSISCWFPC